MNETRKTDEIASEGMHTVMFFGDENSGNDDWFHDDCPLCVAAKNANAKLIPYRAPVSLKGSDRNKECPCGSGRKLKKCCLKLATDIPAS